MNWPGLVKRPRMQRDPLGPSESYPVADAGEVFQGDSAAGAFGLGHDAFSDDVVGVGREPGLFAVAFLQQPLRGLRGFGLQLRAQPLVAMPNLVQGFAAESGAVA